MEINEVLEKLCWHDIRHPDYGDYLEFNNNDSRGDCYCDNCFYGRTKLANYILELLEKDNFTSNIRYVKR